MLRNFCFVLVIIYIFNFSYSLAQDTINNKSYEDVRFLINDGLTKNYELIKSKSKDITLTQKLFLFGDTKKSPSVPFILNLFLGFGIGSWSQLDESGGALGTLGGVVGIYLVTSSSNYSFSKGLGYILFVGTWMIDLIMPFPFSSKYNKKLKNALGISDKTNLMILPNVNVTQNGNVAPGFTFSLNF